MVVKGPIKGKLNEWNKVFSYVHLKKAVVLRGVGEIGMEELDALSAEMIISFII